MPIPFHYDYDNPDYIEVFDWRVERLKRIRKNPECLPTLKSYYRDNIAQFIIDWGVTFDPRNIEIGRAPVIPFILFPRQEEFVHWVIDCWKGKKSGVCDKSRDMGVSWLITAIAASMCLLNNNMVIGFGSRKEEYIDRKDSPKTLFYKIRKFVEALPPEFRGRFKEKKNSPSKRISFPDTDSHISGEAGDGIGRGDRASIYFVDEAAFLARPVLIDASLSNTTNCRIDVSTQNGPNTSFAAKIKTAVLPRFEFDWHSDPRKNQVWYDKMCLQIDNPVIIASEIDRDMNASVEGVLIPPKWVDAIIDAHVKLGIERAGTRRAGFDVADEGSDKCALAGVQGVIIESLFEWTGQASDIYESTEKVVDLAIGENITEVRYDADGLGAGVRGDAKKIKEKTPNNISFIPFHGSGAVVDKDAPLFGLKFEGEGIEKTNGQFFANAKCQSWWALKNRVKKTYRWVVQGEACDPSEIISISSEIADHKLLSQLKSELSQPRIKQSLTGQHIIDKTPSGSRSPNLADAVMIAFAILPTRQLRITDVDI